MAKEFRNIIKIWKMKTENSSGKKKKAHKNLPKGKNLQLLWSAPQKKTSVNTQSSTLALQCAYLNFNVFIGLAYQGP
jgi:hypothetical protein